MEELQLVKPAPAPNIGESMRSSKTQALMFCATRSQLALQQLERVAPTEATVLIVGETGTGKELAARQIHELSRVPGPFIAFNCAAVSESLVEAELFGHEAGAFTGAPRARAGWFEAASGGTLFLDEIGDMPLSLQARLLRVLQERQVVRLGSRKPIPVSMRVVAATNVDLGAAVQARQFRRDLYYRLNVAVIRMLPLRERRGDVLPLARHFLEVYRHSLSRSIERVGLSAAAERLLLTHDWPGNIRELENIIHVGLIMSRDGMIDVADLRLPGSVGARARREDTSHGDALDGLGLGMRRLLDTDRSDVYEEIERLLLTTAFEHCSRNQVQTARRLGVSRNVVRAQLKRFGLLGQESAPTS